MSAHGTDVLHVKFGRMPSTFHSESSVSNIVPWRGAKANKRSSVCKKKDMMRSFGKQMIHWRGTLWKSVFKENRALVLPQPRGLPGNNGITVCASYGNGYSHDTSNGRSMSSQGASRRDAYGQQSVGQSNLRPSIRDHRELIQNIQEKSAEDLKRHNSVSRSRAKVKYQQKIRRSSVSQLGSATGENGTRVNTHDANGASLKYQTESTRMSDEEAKVSLEVEASMEVVPSTRRRGSRVSPAPSPGPSMGSSLKAKESLSYASDEDIGGGLDDVIDDDAVKKFYHNEPPLDVHVVETVAEAQRIMSMLMTQEMEERTFACDTEVMDIDVTRESPCCHGKVTCFSLYCGPDVHFGNTPHADGQPKKTMLWVDTWLGGREDTEETSKAIMDIFKPFFESDNHKKVWHNYSFDRHVLERMNVTCNGFYGDTMHMARLWDSSRTGRGGYSLEALTSMCLFSVR